MAFDRRRMTMLTPEQIAKREESLQRQRQAIQKNPGLFLASMLGLVASMTDTTFKTKKK